MANSTAADYVSTLRARAVADGNLRTAKLDYPEKNGGVVTITTVPLTQHNGKLYTSFVLSMETDVR